MADLGLRGTGAGLVSAAAFGATIPAVTAEGASLFAGVRVGLLLLSAIVADDGQTLDPPSRISRSSRR